MKMRIAILATCAGMLTLAQANVARANDGPAAGPRIEGKMIADNGRVEGIRLADGAGTTAWRDKLDKENMKGWRTEESDKANGMAPARIEKSTGMHARSAKKHRRPVVGRARSKGGQSR
jgi:hypothetical protein